VRVKKGASIWFGAVLRGDNDWITVGENSNVQDLSLVHADAGQPVEIGRNVTIGHRVIVHSASVGDNALIGMGAILLNRAVIGANCLVGAAALVTEGKVFEDGQMILGSPAKAIKPLTDEQIAGLGLSAETYVANAKRYRDALKA
jgi:carbonic anhydrase/acetyltransferase-like protein (isoleucine patch superfamily)